MSAKKQKSSNKTVVKKPEPEPTESGEIVPDSGPDSSAAPSPVIAEEPSPFCPTTAKENFARELYERHRSLMGGKDFFGNVIHSWEFLSAAPSSGSSKAGARQRAHAKVLATWREIADFAVKALVS